MFALNLQSFCQQLYSHSVDGSKDTERLGRFINDDHIKPNSKIKIVSPSLYYLLVLIYTYSFISSSQTAIMYFIYIYIYSYTIHDYLYDDYLCVCVFVCL